MPLVSIVPSKAETLQKRLLQTEKGVSLFNCYLIPAIESSTGTGCEILNTMGKSLRVFPILPFI
ncbi:MAG: hypothetical protein AUI36_06920 [Cyanobacteria bacterium 13_1_40CM_2_61_4]|nr:MAG: hypothetical protein AUI36_06920 [Cyanobacteria bacterium 13_1_40CM_2_61_4]